MLTNLVTLYGKQIFMNAQEQDRLISDQETALEDAIKEVAAYEDFVAIQGDRILDLVEQMDDALDEIDELTEELDFTKRSKRQLNTMIDELTEEIRILRNFVRLGA